MGKEFNPADYMAAAERVLTTEQKNAIAFDLALNEWQQRPGKPSGSITTRHPRFKFATRTTNKRGIYLSADYFDVPPEDIWNSTDIDVFEELMTLIKHGDGSVTREVICEAAKKMDDQVNGLTHRWVAMGFMNMVSEALGFFATHANWGEYLERKRTECATSKKRYEDGQREHMAMMTRKSAEARLARNMAKKVAMLEAPTQSAEAA